MSSILRRSVKKALNQAYKAKTPLKKIKPMSLDLNNIDLDVDWNNLGLDADFQDDFEKHLGESERDNTFDSLKDTQSSKITDTESLTKDQPNQDYIKKIINGKFLLLTSKKQITTPPQGKVTVDMGGSGINPITVHNRIGTTEVPKIAEHLLLNESPVVKIAKYSINEEIPIKDFAPDILYQSQIKGILRPLRSTGKQVKQGSCHTDYFQANFFPPKHIRAYYRRSKVALQIHCIGHTVNDPELTISKNDTYKSFVTSDYAWFRSKWRELIRSEFLKIYKEVGGPELDGLYVIIVKIYPTTPEAKSKLRKDLRGYLEKIKRQKFSDDDIQRANSIMTLKSLKSLLIEYKLKPHDPPPFIKMPHSKRANQQQRNGQSWDALKSVFDGLDLQN